MTLLIDNADVSKLASMPMAIEAMEHVYSLAGQGLTGQPQRYDVPLLRGWLRIMVVEAQGLGLFGYKAMNLFPGVGVRYAVYLYDEADGNLDAIVDAKQVTALRTAACAAVAASRLAPADVQHMALIGTGAEARTQLLAMEAVRAVPTVSVYSRSPDNRRRFIEEMAPLANATLRDCSSVDEAVAEAQLVVLATKSYTNVLEAGQLPRDVHVSSVGAARLDQRELAPDVFAAAGVTVCDEVELVSREAGDVVAAREAGAFDPARALSLSQLVSNADGAAGRDGSAVTLFKSVGSALQDLALASRIVQAARENGLGRQIDGYLDVK